jgi:hypothetical protein
MTLNPVIPMSPTALPQQRLRLVENLPAAPRGWIVSLAPPNDAAVPRTRPRSARYVGQVEWAWSPMHMRIDAYWLSMDRQHRRWLLWLGLYDDNWSRWTDGGVIAHAPRGGLHRTDACRLLLHAWWASEAQNDIDRFHWVNASGLLDAGGLLEVARAAWKESE